MIQPRRLVFFAALLAGTAGWSQPLLTLPDAIRLALANNPNIKVESYSPEIARANLLAADGAFDPALTFGRSHARSFGYPSVSEPLPSELIESDAYSLGIEGLLPTGLTYRVYGSAENDRGPFNNFTDNYAAFGGFLLTQPLLRGFGFGANLVDVRVARANRKISEWQYRQTLIDTVTDVVTAYSARVLAADELRIARSSRDLASTLLVDNQRRLKAGATSQSDVTAAQAQVAARQGSILSAENAVRASDNRLRELLGERSFPAGGPLLVVDAPPPSRDSIDPAADTPYALANRPDYQAARLGIAIDRAGYAAARNGLLPEVDLVAGYGTNGLDRSFAASRRMVSAGDFPSSSIGLKFSIPLTNAAARGRARAARLQCEQAAADLLRLEADIAVAVANGANEIRTARRKVAAEQAAYELQRTALADEVRKLRAGSPESSTYSVIQAQGYLIEVENGLAGALDEERQAVALYDRETARTLPRYRIDPAGR